MDLIERVARALAIVDPDQEGLTYDPRLYEGLARAAIAEVLDAMGEPSEAMIEAGFRARSNDMTMAESAAATWQAMLAQFKAENKL